MIRWKVSADTGGTFTDCLAEGPDGELRRGKVLSSGRLRTLVEEILPGGWLKVRPFGIPDPGWLAGKSAYVAAQAAGAILEVRADAVRLAGCAATVTAGDLLEVDSGLEAPVLALQLLVPAGAGELSFRIGTTKGTNALLEKKTARVGLFLTRGFEDLLLIRDQKRPALFARGIVREPPLHHRVFGVAGRLDADGNEHEPLDVEGLAALAREALDAGCEIAAVCLMHSWRNPAHEERAGRVLAAAGFRQVCLSSRIRPLIKYLDRADTTLVNATLSPVMDTYLDQVQSGIGANPLWIMTSAGGLVSRQRFHAVDSLVSGPAGGMLGAISAGRQAGLDCIIALDMGGTSTDVSRWKQRLELRQHVQVGQARLLSPALPIETVAAGGGSICGFRDGRLHVGPESAGADPGPASYGAGGPLTLTDIHLLLGRIDPSGFGIPLRMEAARAALGQALQASGETDWHRLAEGFLLIATERMAHAIRQVSLRDGEDPARYGLVVFGGAGGLHACRLADLLGIRRIIFPPDAGLLSARGIHYAPREAVREEQLFGSLDTAGSGLAGAFARLEEQARQELAGDGVAPGQIDAPARTVYLRIAGQETGMPVEWAPGSDLQAAFRASFSAVFGYFPGAAVLEVVKLRIRLQEKPGSVTPEAFPADGPAAPADGWVDGFVDGRARRISVHARERLLPGGRMDGPAIIRDPFGTCFIEAGWHAVAGSHGSIELQPAAARRRQGRRLLAGVERALVLNRMEGLVEEMGDQLRRTALSTNIRERLDFSCALLDAQGRLLVNAPHIPVHLGALGLCVRECVRRLEPEPGDVIITNHPAFGGSHLPDVTLICGLFDQDRRLVGYLANRAHHAELGGRTPGSMPADATRLIEEGVIIPPRWLIRRGRDTFDELENLLGTGLHPSRALRENRIDIEAQLASLQAGRRLFAGLLDDYGTAAVERHFAGLYRNAADALARHLRAAGPFAGEATEELDDGHRIRVQVHSDTRRLRIDFSGTSPVHPGNLNATPAIVRSTVLYVLRLLVDVDMPLNEGLLDKLEMVLPEGFLNPSFPADPAACPAVVGGNVETSQRLAGALIRALGILAGGQGTMNNLLFGNSRFGYYETIGGGAGAGEVFDGASGVHVHMTNTAITDPEILEQRFPVLCREFSLRRGTGGAGRHRGGDGLVREIAFREPVSLSLLSQHRRHGPRGLHGGGDGAPGRQWIVRADGSREPVPGTVQLELAAGEGIRVETPGGGGWGAA